jgi:hypothetical protein
MEMDTSLPEEPIPEGLPEPNLIFYMIYVGGSEKGDIDR